MRFRHMTSLLLVFGAVAVLGPAVSYAVPLPGSLQVGLSIFGSNLTIVDNVPLDINPTTGQMSLLTPLVIGDWTVNSLTATGSPVAAQGRLDLSYSLTSSAALVCCAAQAVAINVIQSGYDHPFQEFALSGSGTGPPEQTVAFSLYVGNPMYTRIVDSGSISGSSFNFTERRSGSTGGNYSLILSANIVAPTNASGNFVYTGNVTASGPAAVPEPSGILSLGIALTGLFLFKKRLTGLRRKIPSSGALGS